MEATVLSYLRTQTSGTHTNKLWPGSSPLLIVLKYDFQRIAQAIIKCHPAEIATSDEKGTTALMICASYKEYLLNFQPYDYRFRPSQSKDWAKATSGTGSLIFHHSDYARKRTRRLLLRAKGIDMDKFNSEGKTALCIAIECGSSLAFELLKRGANPNIGCPLDIAIDRENDGMTRAMLQSGADPKQMRPRTVGNRALRYAVHKNYPVIVDALLKSGASIQIAPWAFVDPKAALTPL
jgi:ankyrin repeat protein